MDSASIVLLALAAGFGIGWLSLLAVVGRFFQTGAWSSTKPVLVSSGVCHCGQDMASHAAYDNHSPNEMTRWECPACHGVVRHG